MAFSLFLYFFVLGLSTAPFAVLFEVDFSLDEFAILARPVVDACTLGAREFDELVL